MATPGGGEETGFNPLDSLPTTNVTGFCTINERGIGSLDLVDLTNTVVINLIVFVALLVLFERQRHKRSVYFCRDEWLKHRKPPELPKGFLAWVRPLMSTPKERILQLAGLDAYMLLRYIRLCLKVCLASGFFGLVVLVPLYLHGNREKPYDGNLKTIMRDPKLISMGNIKDHSYLWVPIAMAYFTTLHTLYLLKREYKRFLTLRLTYMSVGDPDVNVQKSFSIMVDRIPAEYRSNTALFALFDEIFPGDVHSAVVALRIDGLEDLVSRRTAAVDALERALAQQAVTGKEPTHFVPENGSFWNRLRCRGKRVESVPYYQAELDLLNARITQVQVAIRQESDAINRKEEARQESRRQLLEQQRRHHPAAHATRLGSRRLSVSPFLVGDAETRINMMGRAELVREVMAAEGTMHLDSAGDLVSTDAEAGDAPVFMPPPSKSHRRLQMNGASGENGSGGSGAEAVTVGTSSPYDHPQEEEELQRQQEGEEAGSATTGSLALALDLQAAQQAEQAREDAANDEEMARSYAATPKQSVHAQIKQLAGRALSFGRNTGRIAVGAGREVTRAVGLLAANTSMSSTAFVTFKSMSSAAVASQSLLTMEPFMFTIHPAPEPRDIAFDNVSTPLRLIEWREAATTVLFVFLSVFWGGLVSALYKLQSWLQKSSEADPDLQNLGYWGNFALSLGIDYVPTVILLIIMALLPLFFWWTSIYYERMRTYSDCDASVMSRYFYYQMVNIYATIVGGALLEEVMAIAKDPRLIVRVLGCQVPVVAVYFMQVIVTKAFSAVMWEFSRAWPLLRQTFMHTFIDYDRLTHRQKRSSLLYKPAMYYGWTYPSLLLVLTICLTYDVIMPVTLLLGAVYFCFIEILYTYHLLYVYVPQYESGGRMWYKVFNRTLVALLLSHLTLIGYMAVLGASNLTPALIPLPMLLVPFYRHCQNGYEAASCKLSLLAARRIDASLREEDDGEDDNLHDEAARLLASATPSPLPPMLGAAAGSSGHRPHSQPPQQHQQQPHGGAPDEPKHNNGATDSVSPPSLDAASSIGSFSTALSDASAPPALGQGMGRKRRSFTTVAAEGSPTASRASAANAASILEASRQQHLQQHPNEPVPHPHPHPHGHGHGHGHHHEKPLVVEDYFEISAYAQPSLTEGPQLAENLPAQRRPLQPEPEHPPCALAPGSASVSPRPLSLSASAHAALAKRLKNPGGFDGDFVEPLNPIVIVSEPSVPSSGATAASVGSAGSGGEGRRGRSRSPPARGSTLSSSLEDSGSSANRRSLNSGEARRSHLSDK